MIIEKYSNIRPNIPIDKKMANLLQENRYGQLDLNKSIENIIHFIWVRRPIPELYTKGLKSYAKKCVNHKIYLWVDDCNKKLNIPSVEIKQIDSLTLVNKHVYNEVSEYDRLLGAWQSDILRYELIDKFGGIYLDVDSHCRKNMNDAVFLKSFAAYNKHYKNKSTNSSFGFYKSSPIMKYALDAITLGYKLDRKRHDPLSLSGPYFFTKILYHFNENNLSMIHTPEFQKEYFRHFQHYNWAPDKVKTWKPPQL